MSIWHRVIPSFSAISILILLGFLLFLMRNAPQEAVIAFVGVLTGGLITGFVQFWISEADRVQQLRLAALDKRLKTAQEAHSLWFQLRRLPPPDKANSSSILKVLRKSEKWWETNSLYLTAEARDAFKSAYKAADNLVFARQNRASLNEINGLKSDIERAGRIIEESVYLPSIGELVSQRKNKKPNKSDA